MSALYFGLQIAGLQCKALKKRPMFLMSEESLIRLENGGVIAFEEYGDENGLPVIFCHGWPSSRTMARLTDKAARELGVRIISPDRPGISGSSLHPNRKLLDWPPFVQRLVDGLDIGEFRVLRFRWRSLCLCDGQGDAESRAGHRDRERCNPDCRSS